MKHSNRTQLLQAALLLVLSTLLLQGQAYAGAPAGAVPVNITGEITVLYADDFDNKRAELQYFIEEKQSKKRFRLQFDGTPPGHLRTGKTLTVHGKAKGKELFLAADGVDSSSAENVAPAVVAVTGEQKTLVMVANFTDANVSCPVDSIRDLMFTDAADQSIDDLYQETSYGGIWLTGQVLGPYNLNYSSGTCDYSAWGQAADAAARASGVEPDAYNRKVYVMPQNGCPAAGIGTVGGNPSRAWIFHCDIADVFGHEFGHNLGMHHAATPGSEYGDNTDIMGIGQNRLRQINAPHKEQMGWLPAFQTQTITQSGFYDIAPLELDAAGALAPQALKIHKPDTSEYYYLSYRRGIGFDANLIASLYLDRLSVHSYAGDGSATKTYLLDLAADGESFSDTANGITVTQLSHNNDYVTIEVSLDGSDPTPTCTPATPQVSLSPGSQSASAGSTLNYTVSVTNNDNTACAASAFTLNDSIPSGWTGSLSVSSLNLLPGETGSATFSVTSASGDTTGSYGISVSTNGSNAVHNATGSASYTVVASCAVAVPTLSLSPGSQSGDPGTTLVYNISLTNNDSSACSASTFNLTRILPGWSGSVSPNSMTLSPGESGAGTLSATSPGTAAPGSYTLQVQASDTQEAGHYASKNATYVVNEIAQADTTAPTAPSGLAASGNTKQVSLTWNSSSDNVGVVGYRVIRDGIVIATTAATSYADRSGTTNVMYTYTVDAYDAANNASAESNPVTAGKAKTKGQGGGKGKGPNK